MSDTPIWKKELRLRKGRDEAAAKTSAAAGEQKASIWKREPRLRQPDAAKSPTPASEPTAAADPVDTTNLEMTPSEMTPAEMTPTETSPNEMSAAEMTPSELIPAEMPPLQLSPEPGENGEAPEAFEHAPESADPSSELPETLAPEPDAERSDVDDVAMAAAGSEPHDPVGEPWTVEAGLAPEGTVAGDEFLPASSFAPSWSATSRIDEVELPAPEADEVLPAEPASEHPGYRYVDEYDQVGELEPAPVPFEPVDAVDPEPAAAHGDEEPEPVSTPTEDVLEQTDVPASEPMWSIAGSQVYETRGPEPASDAGAALVATLAPVGATLAATELLPAPDETAPEAPRQGRFKRDVGFPPRHKRKPKDPTRLTATSDAHAVKNLLGLRIGSSQLAAARVRNNGEAELLQIARTPLARGIVSGGEVRDVEGLTRALKAFFAEHKLPRRGVRLGIASNRIGVRLLEVPKVDDAKLFENSVRFHAQETLPIAVSDAILDHVVLGDGDGQGLDATSRVLLVFAHRELVDRHVEACRRAGVKLDGIDLEAFALLRALAVPRSPETEPEQAIVAVAVGQERTIFAVSDGRVCDFTRVLEWGGGSLDIAIARALDLTPSQAEPLKLALSLDGDAAPSQLTPEKADEARAAIRNELQALSRELVSSLQFYQARSGSLDIGEILLTGGGAQLPGFAAELEQLIGVPVRMADPFARVTMGRKFARPADAGSLAVAIGLAIED